MRRDTKTARITAPWFEDVCVTKFKQSIPLIRRRFRFGNHNFQNIMEVFPKSVGKTWASIRQMMTRAKYEKGVLRQLRGGVLLVKTEAGLCNRRTSDQIHFEPCEECSEYYEPVVEMLIDRRCNCKLVIITPIWRQVWDEVVLVSCKP